MSSFSTRPLRVEAVRYQAKDTLSVELVDEAGKELPEFTAGAHIDLVLGNGIVRSYSLSNDPAERHRYVIGVHRAPQSRGGSEWIHTVLRPGAVLEVSDPLNNFELDESAASSILVAGGIGITPMLSMARRLESTGQPWHLYYAVREPSLVAFSHDLAELEQSRHGRITLHVDTVSDGGFLDLAEVVARAADGTHVYCCGPAPMLAAFEEAATVLPAGTSHVEHFSNDNAPDTSGGFEVTLQRSGLTLTVPAGKTILDVMLGAGVDVPYSCTEGICGTCETAVLDGVPDHRDLVLTDSEKDANDVMMVCCSGSSTPRLVLDA